jgi:Phage major coat protein, Gp8
MFWHWLFDELFTTDFYPCEWVYCPIILFFGVFVMKTIKSVSIWVLSVLGLFLGVVGSASAALNAGVAAGFTQLQTDALALVDLVWPVAIAVTVAFIILGLFKRAAGKAV